MMAAFQRGRRHDPFQTIQGISLSAIIICSLVFLFVFNTIMSLTAPRFVDYHQLHEIQHFPLPPVLFVNSFALRENAIEAVDPLVVPRGREVTHDLWRSMQSHVYFGCSNPLSKFPTAEAINRPDTYLMIATSGGLNQQRTGIIDAVVAARILKATLVVPKLDQKSFWNDTSDFTEIFNVDWFISSLSKDVKVVKQLPKKEGKYFASPYTMRVPRKCDPTCYENRVLPVLLKKHVVQLTKFDFRLANKLDPDLQKLRCRVNYHALKFTDPIVEMGNMLVERMREKSKNFIALHLRFEPDMLAFSGCDFGGGEKEKTELGLIRKRWKTLHDKNPEIQRKKGKCPLAPEEAGLMLRALGYGSDVHIYVASGEIYKGDETLAPLKAMFPNFHSKESLATDEELVRFSSFTSRLAALDFIVCDESDVFVTNNNGNMARILAGRRRYFGHKRTIRPNNKKLNSLFQNRARMSWEAFASKILTVQTGFMGEPNEASPGRDNFYEFPSTCICQSLKNSESESSNRKNPVESSAHFYEKEGEWPDVYGDESLEFSSRLGSRFDLSSTRLEESVTEDIFISECCND
ncbi:Peptide-O-fucosyltransferase [Zostera marina]|uniref:O-fucosyltransferase family protein n=1 Tax=Zostera marina TaxID=29655 RepID=A0A0K9NQU3_ZOSMR|nr:Peptide-O-fucosyltransferase [Zostera marina]